MTPVRVCSRSVLVAITLATTLAVPAFHPSRHVAAAARCSAFPAPSSLSTRLGRLYTPVAYHALAADRARLAGLGPQRQSTVLAWIAEEHSLYMASIGSWSDGDPQGGILTRVRAAGLDATYAGQNVVTASASTVPAAIAQGEAFFAAEANGGGPHWDNITNPNHHFTGIGIAVLGSQGSYTIYLTQVFSDAGGCTAATTAPSVTTAAAITGSVRPGETMHPMVDTLQLRSAPHGMVIGQLHPADALRVIEVQQGWVQVKVVATNTYGWVFGALLTQS